MTCGQGYGAEEAPEYVCEGCARGQVAGRPLVGMLECEYDYGAWRGRGGRGAVGWEVLWPCREEEVKRIGLRVGGTPLYDVEGMARRAGVARVMVKDESVQPTGSLKDRATQLALAMALRRGVRDVTCASTGNAACSLAGLSAAVGLRAHIFVPACAPRGKLVQIAAYGAELIAVEGTYDDCFEMSIRATREHGWYNRNTGYNPWTIEGKKSVAWEIGEQCGGRVPSQVFVPTGDGVIISGVYKGFYDLWRLGWVEAIPRLVAVQPEGSAAIARAIAGGGDGREAQHAGACSVADSLVVAAPRAAVTAVRAVRASGGYAVCVSDEEILRAITELAELAGVYAEPAGAAAWAGLLKAREKGLISAGESALLLITGSGLKDHVSAERAVALRRGREWCERKM